MGDIDLDAIEARANAATGGRWEAYRVNRIAPLYGVGSGEAALTQDVGTWQDAEFIAHARADIPALIAEVRRLREAESNKCGHDPKNLATARITDTMGRVRWGTICTHCQQIVADPEGGEVRQAEQAEKKRPAHG